MVRPVVNETTALGAAYAAGLAVGYWSGEDEIVANWAADKTWEPDLASDAREAMYDKWNRAVERTYDSV